MRSPSKRHALLADAGQVAIVLLLASLACSGRGQSAPDSNSQLSIPVRVPLRVELTSTIPLKTGKQFRGRLMEPVYGPDRMLLPAGVTAEGVISATPAAGRSTRVNAELDGDFTPLRVPVIHVMQLVLLSGAVLPVDAVGGMRNAETISLAAHPQPRSLGGRIKAMAHAQLQQVHEMIHNPHKGDRLKQFLYAQLAYHPQRVWAGSQFDAVLCEPLHIPVASASPPMHPANDVDLTSGRMQARLTTGISSASAKRGDPVNAVLVRPFCNARGQIMLAGGTPLRGVVLQARRSRWFARNGKLRFDFRSVGRPDAGRSRQQIEGGLTSIQGQKGQNVALDSEGGTRAQPNKGRFLAPLTLGVLAVGASTGDSDDIVRQGVTSNGFGLFARILSIAAASPAITKGFAYFALGKSIYRRFIARGHEISFPTNTELAIDLSRR